LIQELKAQPQWCRRRGCKGASAPQKVFSFVENLGKFLKIHAKSMKMFAKYLKFWANYLRIRIKMAPNVV